MKRNVITIAAACLAASFFAATIPASTAAVKPEGHLEPERSEYGDDLFMPGYDALVRSVLKSAYANDVAVRMIAVPSFFPEFSVGLKGNSGSYQVFSMRPKVQLWGYEILRMRENGALRTVVGDANKNASDLRATLPPNPQDVPVVSCYAGIKAELAGRIVANWERMLRSTRFPGASNIGTDGADYHFSMRVNSQFLAGHTWNPDPNSPSGMLVRIGLAMNDYCAKKSDASTKHLEQLVTQLEGRLSDKGGEPRVWAWLVKIQNWFSGWRQGR